MGQGQDQEGGHSERGQFHHEIIVIVLLGHFFSTG
jgi:hypothetical protein